MVNNHKSMRLLQITDLHLKADPTAHIHGRIIRESLEHILNIALHEKSAPDLIIISGDISDETQAHNCKQTYQYLQNRLKQFSSKLRCIPGNHDTPSLLYNIFGLKAKSHLEINNWQLLFLSSHMKSSISGHIDEIQLKALLDNRVAENTIIFMHHHPIPIDSHWLDQIGLQNNHTFFNILKQYKGIRGVVFGHIHQEFESYVAGIKILGTPAANPQQFLPKADTYTIDNINSSGFRWLTLHPNGHLDTQVIRV